jgi:hypothetical protein
MEWNDGDSSEELIAINDDTCLFLARKQHAICNSSSLD